MTRGSERLSAHARVGADSVCRPHMEAGCARLYKEAVPCPSRRSVAVAAAAFVLALAAAAQLGAESTGGEQAGGCVEQMRRGNPYTSRPLAKMNRMFRPHDVVALIEAAIAANGGDQARVRVLEFGMGEGRLLMELRQRFPRVDLHGINKCRWTTGDNQAWLLQTGVHFGLFDPAGAAAMKPIVPHFRDVDEGDLAFLEDGFFDVVISQVSIGYVNRKDRLIESFWRVLKPGGVALLDLDNLLLMRSGNSLPLDAFFASVRGEGFDVAVESNEFPFLLMRKNTDRPLALKLRPERVPFSIFVDPRGSIGK